MVRTESRLEGMWQVVEELAINNVILEDSDPSIELIIKIAQPYVIE